MGLGDVKVAEARGYEAAQRAIIEACKLSFTPENKADCSGFARAVAERLGISLKGQANEIYGQVEGSPWLPLGTGDAASRKAAVAARQGFFVVAVWKNPQWSGPADKGHHGHVAVVTDLQDLEKKFPEGQVSRYVSASWGSLGDQDSATLGGPIRSTFAPTSKLPSVLFSSQYIRKFT